MWCIRFACLIGIYVFIYYSADVLQHVATLPFGPVDHFGLSVPLPLSLLRSAPNRKLIV